jgi:hypothetical protein
MREQQKLAHGPIAVPMDIHLSEVGQGKWRAVLGDEVLVVSRQPFLDAARVLKARGVDPVTPLIAFRPNGVVSLRSTVGAASELTGDGK